MQQLTGRFADLNTSNMLVGEFAVPNDHNPVVKMDNGKIREIPLLSDMDSYENKIQEVNGAIVKLNNEYESTKTSLLQQLKQMLIVLQKAQPQQHHQPAVPVPTKTMLKHIWTMQMHTLKKLRRQHLP